MATPHQVLNLKQVIRRIAGARSNAPIRVIAGDQQPSIRGTGHSWVTPGGRPVHHPNAYRKAFGKPIYRPSTLRVLVGEDWAMHKGLVTRRLTQQSL